MFISQRHFLAVTAEFSSMKVSFPPDLKKGQQNITPILFDFLLCLPDLTEPITITFFKQRCPIF